MTSLKYALAEEMMLRCFVLPSALRHSFLLMLLSAICSCRSLDSTTKHTFGETTVPAKNLKDCKGNLRQVWGPIIDPSNAYLTTLAKRIATANPDSFKGEYAIEKFCFTIENTTMDNAYADSTQRQISFSSTMLKNLDNDAQVAAILSHELAHVLRQHSTNMTPSKLKDDRDWQMFEGQAEFILNAAQEKADEVTKRYSKVAENQQKFKAKVIAPFQPDYDKIKEALLILWMSIFAPQSTEMAPAIPSRANNPVQQDLLDLMAKLRTELFDTDIGQTPGVAYAAPNSPAIKLLSIDEQKQELARLNAFFNKVIGTIPGTALEAERRELSNAAAQCEKDLGEFEALKWKIDYERKAIIDKAYNNPGAGANWSEQEADEVGFELYLRAGFAASQFTGFLVKTIGDDLASCLALVSVVPPIANAIDRKTASHPVTCWRIFDNEVLEANAHRQDYAPLLPKATIVTLEAGKLQELKDFLAKLQPPSPPSKPSFQ